MCKLKNGKIKNKKADQSSVSLFWHDKSFLLIMLLLSIFILSFLTSTSYASSTCTSSVQCPQGQICDKGECRDCLTSAECLSKTFLKSTPVGGMSSWFVISIIIIFIAFTGVGILYMIAYLFQSEQYKRIAFAELMQVAASFLLIAFLFGFETFETDMVTQLEKTSGAITSALVFSTGGISQSTLSGQIQINPFDVSYAFLRNMLKCGENQLKTIYDSSKGIETIINTNIQVTAQTPGKLNVGFPNPFALVSSLSELASKYEYDSNELTWLVIFLYAQIAVLKFFETSMMTVFLPIGIILRSFPPTRGAGAVLVAIAIGFYFVYPLSFVLLYAGTPPVIEGCNIKVQLDTTQIEKTCPLNLGATTEILASSSDLISMGDALIPQLQAGISTMKFAAFTYMLISLGITFIFVRSLSSILGADISEIGRSMLRLL